MNFAVSRPHALPRALSQPQEDPQKAKTPTPEPFDVETRKVRSDPAGAGFSTGMMWTVSTPEPMAGTSPFSHTLNSSWVRAVELFLCWLPRTVTSLWLEPVRSILLKPFWSSPIAFSSLLCLPSSPGAPWHRVLCALVTASGFMGPEESRGSLARKDQHNMSWFNQGGGWAQPAAPSPDTGTGEENWKSGTVVGWDQDSSMGRAGAAA